MEDIFLKKNTNYFRRKLKKLNIKETYPLMLMSYPFFIMVILFAFVPMWGLSIAFFDYFPGTSIFKQEFVGVKYFIRIYNDKFFLQALRNTLVTSFLALTTYLLPPLFAILLNEIQSVKFKKTIQTIASFPNFISWIITYSLFFTLFSIDDGLFNQILMGLNIIKEPTNILGNENIAWYFQVFGVAVWKNLGWSSIIYFATISNIDQQLFEAAKIDGAGRFRQILHITIPSLIPIFTILMVLAASNILSAGFDQYYMFTNPLTFSKLDNIDTYTYRVGLQGYQYSFATAIGIGKSIVSISLLFVITNIIKKITGEKLF